MSREDVRQTQSIARLRVHVERCIRRVKENKLFDRDIPLSVCGSIEELFNVACFLVNYQYGPLVFGFDAVNKLESFLSPGCERMPVLLYHQCGEALLDVELIKQREMERCLALILLTTVIQLITAVHVNVRLVGGPSRCAGRVEVYHRGQWGTVCDEDWDLADAAVVCRELDCGEPVDALSDAHFGPGSGPIWKSYVMCTGSESMVEKCGSGGWEKYNCDHSKDAGVICSEVRLVGGSRCSGRLEILDGQTWVSVCAAAFDQQDAEVVCRELDCGAPVQVLEEDAFGKGDAQMWTQEIQCRGNESQIHLCPTSLHKNNCSHEHNIVLLCTVAVLVEWRFFIEVSGKLCVVSAGIWLMLQWCVESWTVENL
ncbi:Antigen WC1.1 [Anabarilius grahami]|uniref:Antigen WC1.1 n=1 Tax=Anabarilius grahami TaxID=495550 RepID=A0A3N0XDF4_ANAGA|nr:Antigen WC1.1 [Anabarilius grahami]